VLRLVRPLRGERELTTDRTSFSKAWFSAPEARKTKLWKKRNVYWSLTQGGAGACPGLLSHCPFRTSVWLAVLAEGENANGGTPRDQCLFRCLELRMQFQIKSVRACHSSQKGLAICLHDYSNNQISDGSSALALFLWHYRRQFTLQLLTKLGHVLFLEHSHAQHHTHKKPHV